MENQFRQECGTTDDDSCGCSCHPGSGAGDCSGCARIHGSSKMEAMDPFEMVMEMWHKASFEAYSELMIEKLKKRIEAANGPVMDKVADALMESMGKEWQAMVQKSSAKKELHEKLAKIFSEGSQKQK
ncbi:MAG: hypothetical protein M3Y53_03005 [Thermoproteota archaeon]|nr:hypothetical protein [Thermoproteota archaeon]